MTFKRINFACVNWFCCKFILLSWECQNIIYHFRSADQLRFGDEILVQRNDEFTPEKILNVSHSVIQGDYNSYSLLHVLQSKLQHSFILIDDSLKNVHLHVKI